MNILKNVSGVFAASVFLTLAMPAMAAPTVQFSTQFDGTPAATSVMKGSKSISLFNFSATANTENLEVRNIRGEIRSAVGCFVKQSKGTPSFTNIRIVDRSTGATVMGPLEIPATTVNSSRNSGVLRFNDVFTVLKGTRKNLSVVADVANTEDAVGDLYGKGPCAMTFGLFRQGLSTVYSTTRSKYLTPEEISFPASAVLTGNLIKVVGIDPATLVHLDVIKGAQPANPIMGMKDAFLGQFYLSAQNGDVLVKKISVLESGSIAAKDLSHFTLYSHGVIVATSSALTADRHVNFTLTTPMLITKGNQQIFSVLGDITGFPGQTIRTYVDKPTNIVATNVLAAAPAWICTTTAAKGCESTSANYDGTGTNYTEVSVMSGILTNAFYGPSTSKVSKGMTGVPFYKFALTSSDQRLEIRKLVFTIAKTAGSADTCTVNGSNGTKYFKSIRIKNLDTGTTFMGPLETSSSKGSMLETLTFTDAFIINGGQTLNLGLVIDLGDTEDPGDTFLDGNCSYTATMHPFSYLDVRIVAGFDGWFVDPSRIIPNATVVGNPQTIKSSHLDVTLASTPISGVLVKKTMSADLAGLVLTASSESDVTVSNLTLTGQTKTVGCNDGKFGGTACNLSGFANDVTSVRLVDATTGMQVGLARAPDSTTGKSLISNMNLVIPKGTSVTLIVRASLSSIGSATSSDQVAVGIASSADIQAQDQDMLVVTPSVSAALIGEVGATPSVVQTILSNGSLTVQQDSHPVTQIVMAGKDAWVVMAQYRATAKYEDVVIDRVSVKGGMLTALPADAADFLQIGVMQGGVVKGQDTLPSGASSTKDVDLSISPIVVPKDSSTDFQLVAKLSNVHSSSSVSGATWGVARSGHAPAMGLNDSLTTGEWNTNYVGKLNVRSKGVASGERIYADKGATNGNVMIMRKSQPIVSRQLLSSTVLINGPRELYKFNVSADSAGSIAWKQIVFKFQKSATVDVMNFRLMKGASEMSSSDYSIRNASSSEDIMRPGRRIGLTEGYIVVSFKPGKEENVSGSGNTYTLVADITTWGPTGIVSFAFQRDPSAAIATGYLTNGVTSIDGTLNYGNSTDIYHVDTAVAADGIPNAPGTFLWSDNSEIPHDPALGTAGGSRDWMNDAYVQDLWQSQTLSF